MIIADDAALRSYLDGLGERLGRDLAPEDVVAFAFGDSAEMADELAALVLDADKRATAGWLDEDDEPGEVEVGDLSVILDGRGVPLGAIRTTEVSVQPLTSVDPAFAWDEGEQDRTRAAWLAAHDGFFRRRAEAVGIDYDPEAPRFRFERFEVVDPELEVAEPLVHEGDVRVRPLRADERAWVRALLGDQADSREVLEASGGYPADRCPALLARDGFRSTGLLVFVPRPDGVEVVRLVALDGKRDDPDAVEDYLRRGLDELTRRYGWGTSEG